jgi:hypothetical protein
MFFAALFVLMKSLEDLQLIEWIGETTASVISGVPEGMLKDYQMLIIRNRAAMRSCDSNSLGFGHRFCLY